MRFKKKLHYTLKYLKNQEKITNKLDIGIVPRFTILVGMKPIIFLGGIYSWHTCPLEKKNSIWKQVK